MELAWQGRVSGSGMAALSEVNSARKLLAQGLCGGSREESQAVSRLMRLVLHCATCAACRNATPACPACSSPFFQRCTDREIACFLFFFL